MIRTPTIEGSEEGSRSAVVVALDQVYNQDRTAEFDLNQRGRDALSELLLSLDPDQVAEVDADTAAAHYDEIAGAIMGVRRDSGMISSWEEIRAIPNVSEVLGQTLRQNADLGDFAVLAAENVGPQIGHELRRKGLLAIGFSLVGMLAYIWFRFELRFGIGALVATLHDVFVTLGLFALAGMEFNLTTIAAFLTLVGYSVNDTVVVFDRVRENMRRKRNVPLVDTLNLSLNQTLSRTVLTSGTTLLVVGSLFFLGGDVLKGFAFILVIGVIVGTYSSIYIASPFTLLWEQTFGREAKQRRAAAAARTAGN